MNKKGMKLIVLMHLVLMGEVTSKIFNKIAHNRRPSQEPFQITNINKAGTTPIVIRS